MRATKAIKEIMKRSNTSNADLAKVIGCSNAVIYERLTQKNISINNLDQMVSAMGYEIVLQPRPEKSGRRPDGVYVIDRGDSK